MTAFSRLVFRCLQVAIAFGIVVLLIKNALPTRYVNVDHSVRNLPAEDEKPTVFYSKKSDCQFHLPFVIPGKVSSKICTHDPSIDTMISGYIKKTQSWEPDDVSSMLNIMAKDVQEHKANSNNSALSFVDLGCNIGVYTFSAAFNSFNVLAVDAMIESLQLLATSLRLANLQSRVMLLNNAISDRHETVVFRVDHSNIGSSRVVQLKTRKDESDSMKKILSVRAVCLDDLVPYVPTQRVFVKMDIEASEWLALRCSDKFFAQVDVAYFMMEWMAYHTQNVESGEAILHYFEGLGFRPFHAKSPDKLLKYEHKHTWPGNIIFMRK